MSPAHEIGSNAVTWNGAPEETPAGAIFLTAVEHADRSAQLASHTTLADN